MGFYKFGFDDSTGACEVSVVQVKDTVNISVESNVVTINEQAKAMIEISVKQPEVIIHACIV